MKAKIDTSSPMKQLVIDLPAYRYGDVARVAALMGASVEHTASLLIAAGLMSLKDKSTEQVGA
jgi:hypothetical protein